MIDHAVPAGTARRKLQSALDCNSDSLFMILGADAIRIGDVVRASEATEIAVAGAAQPTPRKGRNGKPQLNRIFDVGLDAFINVLDRHTLADMSKRAAAPAAPRERSKPPVTTVLADAWDACS